MNKYTLSSEADQDIENIIDYSIKTFGAGQTELYISGLEDKLILLSNQPSLGISRPEIRQALMSSPYESHIIFYQVVNAGIRIIRVLHDGRDIIRYLK